MFIFTRFSTKTHKIKPSKIALFIIFGGQRDAIPYISNELNGKPLGGPKIAFSKQKKRFQSFQKTQKTRTGFKNLLRNYDFDVVYPPPLTFWPINKDTSLSLKIV